MLKHGWKITLQLVILVIVSFGIGGYALVNEDNFTCKLLVELKDFLRIETEVNKGQSK